MTNSFDFLNELESFNNLNLLNQANLKKEIKDVTAQNNFDKIKMFVNAIFEAVHASSTQANYKKLSFRHNRDVKANFSQTN